MSTILSNNNRSYSSYINNAIRNSISKTRDTKEQTKFEVKSLKLQQDSYIPYEDVTPVVGKNIEINRDYLDELRDSIKLGSLGTKLDFLAYLYEISGIEAEPPKNDEDISDTDRALFSLYNLSMQGYPGALEVICYGTTGFENNTVMELVALSIAEKLAWHRNSNSDEEIMKRIESLGLSEDIDKEFLFNAIKAHGNKNLEKLNNNMERAISRLFSQYSKQVYESLEPLHEDFDNQEAGISVLRESVLQLFRHQIERSVELINQDYKGDIAAKLKLESYDDSCNFKFIVNGVEYSRREIDTLFTRLTGYDALKIQML